MRDNTKEVIGWLLVTFFATVCVICYTLFLTVIVMPPEYTINVNLTSDDNSLEMMKTAERMQNQSNEEVICKVTTIPQERRINTSA